MHPIRWRFKLSLSLGGLGYLLCSLQLLAANPHTSELVIVEGHKQANSPYHYAVLDINGQKTKTLFETQFNSRLQSPLLIETQKKEMLLYAMNSLGQLIQYNPVNQRWTSLTLPKATHIAQGPPGFMIVSTMTPGTGTDEEIWLMEVHTGEAQPALIPITSTFDITNGLSLPITQIYWIGKNTSTGANRYLVGLNGALSTSNFDLAIFEQNAQGKIHVQNFLQYSYGDLSSPAFGVLLDLHISGDILWTVHAEGKNQSPQANNDEIFLQSWDLTTDTVIETYRFPLHRQFIMGGETAHFIQVDQNSNSTIALRVGNELRNFKHSYGRIMGSSQAKNDYTPSSLKKAGATFLLSPSDYKSVFHMPVHDRITDLPPQPIQSVVAPSQTTVDRQITHDEIKAALESLNQSAKYIQIKHPLTCISSGRCTTGELAEFLSDMKNAQILIDSHGKPNHKLVKWLGFALNDATLAGELTALGFEATGDGLLRPQTGFERQPFSWQEFISILARAKERLEDPNLTTKCDADAVLTQPHYIVPDFDLP